MVFHSFGHWIICARTKDPFLQTKSLLLIAPPTHPLLLHSFSVEFTTSPRALLDDASASKRCRIACVSDTSPETWGTAKLVPIPYEASSPVPAPSMPTARMALAASPPGAATAIDSPQLLYHASLPSLVLAATAMTPLQLAGKNPETFWLLFPAAATTTAPSPAACVTADWR